MKFSYPTHPTLFKARSRPAACIWDQSAPMKRVVGVRIRSPTNQTRPDVLDWGEERSHVLLQAIEPNTLIKLPSGPGQFPFRRSQPAPCSTLITYLELLGKFHVHYELWMFIMGRKISPLIVFKTPTAIDCSDFLAMSWSFLVG